MRFLFVDRILHLSPDLIQGIKHVTADDYYLCPYPAGKACFIPSLIGETLGQLAAWNVMFHNDFTKRPVAGLVGNAYLYRPVFTGETIFLESHIDALDDVAVRYHSTAKVGEEIVFKVESALGPLLPMRDFIDPGAARLQFEEIYRPLSGPVSQWSAGSPIECSNLVSNSLVQFDRILSSEPGKNLIAEKRITRAAPYFPDHFPNKPVLPMTILLECQLNLVTEFLTQAQFNSLFYVEELRRIKMNEFVSPGDIVICSLSLKEQSENTMILTCRSEVEGKRVCVVDMLLRAKGE